MSVCQILQQASIKYLYILIERIEMVQQFFFSTILKNQFFQQLPLIFIRQFYSKPCMHSSTVDSLRQHCAVICFSCLGHLLSFLKISYTCEYFIQFILNLYIASPVIEFLIFIYMYFLCSEYNTQHQPHPTTNENRRHPSLLRVCLLIHSKC